MPQMYYGCEESIFSSWSKRVKPFYYEIIRIIVYIMGRWQVNCTNMIVGIHLTIVCLASYLNGT